MERVTIGTRVQNLGISKLNVADGTSARCVLIDRNPACKYIAYDEDLGKKVEVDQDILIQYGVKANPTFFFLVAKLNTDMKGNVVDNDFVIEFLQCGGSVYNELADAIEENPQFTSFKLSKVAKKVDGRDYSYIKPTPSNYPIPEAISTKIAALSQEQIDAMWQLIDKTTSMSSAEYKALRANDSEYTYRVQQRASLLASRNGAQPAPQVAAPAPRPQIAAPAQPAYQAPQSVAPAQPVYQAPVAPQPVAPAPSVDFAEVNDFMGAPAQGDDFDF